MGRHHRGGIIGEASLGRHHRGGIIKITIIITFTITTGGIWESSGCLWNHHWRHLGVIWMHLEPSGWHLGGIGEASGRPGLPGWPQGDLRGRSLKKVLPLSAIINFSMKKTFCKCPTTIYICIYIYVHMHIGFMIVIFSNRNGFCA